MMGIYKLLVGIMLWLSFNLANAGIMADMNAMFMSNSSASGTLTTADRSGVFGGSYSMRTPIHQVNLIAFDPPRLNAGCGGVDLYGGSFSFINSAQLVQIFRNVASNAAGLAFKAAIKVISPSLDALITEFQTLLQNLNNLAKNSCSLAHLIVDPAEKAISSSIDAEGSIGATSKGMFSDTASALTGYLQDANSFFAKQAEVNPNAGNPVIKAILASGSTSLLGIAGLPNADGSTDDATDPNTLNNRIVLSMLGYEINGVPCSSLNALGQPDTTLNVSSNNLGRISCSAPAVLNLHDFIKGGGTGSSLPSKPLTLYKCVNPSGAGTPNGGFDPQICTQMQSADYSYEGIDGWVNNMLFGTPDESAIDPASILGLMNSGSSGQFSTAQIQFIHQAGAPLIGLISKTSNPGMRLDIAHRLRTPIEDCVVASLGRAIYQAAKGIQTNNTYPISDAVKANIEKIRTDYLAKEDACVKNNAILEITQLLNQAAILTGNNNK